MSASRKLSHGGSSSSKMEEDEKATPTLNKSHSGSSINSSASSTDSIAHQKKPHAQPQGINIYYHNIQFLGGGPNRPKKRPDDVIKTLGERARECAVTLFVEVMDGTRKDKVMTPEELFKQAVLRIKSIVTEEGRFRESDIANLLPKHDNNRDAAIAAYIDASIKEILADDGIKSNFNLPQLEEKLKIELTKLARLEQDTYMNRRNKEKIKDNTTSAKSSWNTFITGLPSDECRLKMGKNEDSMDEEKTYLGTASAPVANMDVAATASATQSASSSSTATVDVNPGEAELERIRTVAGVRHSAKYQTCGKGTGEGVGLIYNARNITCEGFETIPLMGGQAIRGAVLFRMITDDGHKFGVVGAHLPFGDEQARKQCLKNFIPKMAERCKEEKRDLVVTGDFNITAELEQYAQENGFLFKRGKATSASGKEEYDRTFLMKYNEGGKLEIEVVEASVLHRVSRTTVEGQEITDHLGLHIDYVPGRQPAPNSNAIDADMDLINRHNLADEDTRDPVSQHDLDKADDPPLSVVDTVSNDDSMNYDEAPDSASTYRLTPSRSNSPSP